MKKMVITLMCLWSICLNPLYGADAPTPPKQSWTFSGIFGAFDRNQLQRGFQVFKEVCSACHSIHLLRFDHLKALGYTPAEIKAIASQYSISDTPNDKGEIVARKAKSSDYMVGPYTNKEAARAANNGSLPPDLSLITKARKYGPDYLFALLTGYTKPPADVTVPQGMYYNAYFPGHMIAMANPLNEGAITYADGTKATIDQMARDVTTFLAWASEPEMEVRKQKGIKILIYLIISAILFYIAMHRIWAPVYRSMGK